MIVKRLIFFGQPATHACDGKCHKAWGNNGGRPQIQLSDDEDDYAYLADGELGDAPASGIVEGDDHKPEGVKGPDDINRWCVRECERAWISPPGNPDAPPDLPDFSVRFYNKAPHKRPADAAQPVAPTKTEAVPAELSKEPVDDLSQQLERMRRDAELMERLVNFCKSLRPDQMDGVMQILGGLDTEQKARFMEAVKLAALDQGKEAP